MKLLALESSADLLSVALLHEGRIAERASDGAHSPSHPHSETALPLVLGLLQAAKLGVAQLDGIVYGAGPGAFTGLRLACSLAQGLAFAADCPVLGVDSLEALALAAGSGSILVCTDARMNEVYVAAYRVEGDRIETVSAPQVCPPEQVPIPPGAGWQGAGNGFSVYRAVLEPRLGAVLENCQPHLQARAGKLLQLAAPRFARGVAVDAAQAQPRYVRNKIALTSRERMAAGGKA